MEKKFDDFDIAIYHLIFIGNRIELTFKAFSQVIGEINEEAERVLYVDTSSMILILAHSFLDEYHKFVQSEDLELMATVTNLKKVVKPAMQRINEWRERGDFRNQVLAHNLRGKENQSVFERGLTTYDIPQQGADLHVFVSCIGMVKEVFESTFRERLAAVQEEIDRNQELKAGRRYDGSSFEAAIEAVRLEINANIRALKQEHGVL